MSEGFAGGDWEENPTKAMYDRVREDPGWDVRTWPISHDVVGDGADRLVDLLRNL